MDSISEEKIVRRILVKLPTRDVARCRCVSRRWRRIVADPSFRALHGTDASRGGDTQAENLLVYEIARDATVDMVVLSSPSLAGPMCRVDLTASAGYSPANACNGFLLFAPRVAEDWPVCICNPVTDEKLYLGAPPAVVGVVHGTTCLTYALGYSPSMLQYKLFRLYTTPDGSYMDVGTLGSGDPYRRHPDRLPVGAISPNPALLDGKLYLPCEELPSEQGTILVIDVATEMHCMYRLPNCEGEKVAAVAFELRGRLCVAVHVVGRQKLEFWVMPLCLEQENKDATTRLLHWELRYSFYMDGHYNGRQRGAWFDDGYGMLCYRMGDRLYKYDTTRKDHLRQVGGLLDWDSITQLLPNEPQWNIYGGYRPSLESPDLALVSLQYKEFQESLVRALQDMKSTTEPTSTGL